MVNLDGMTPAQLRAQLELERAARQAEVERATTTEAHLRQVVGDLEQFAYAVSHDLRAPLRNVAGFSQLLVRRHAEKLPSDAREFLQYMESGLKHMQSLIDDLLVYSRVGRIPQSNHARRPLSVALSVAMDQVRFRTQESKAEITLPEQTPELDADHDLLARLFINLFDNALKFQPKGSTPVIEVQAHVEGSVLQVLVIDNGIGIEREHLDSIFGVFTRLHPSDQYEGTGIGLSICRKIAQIHQGRLWAESEGLGRGARMVLELPL